MNDLTDDYNEYLTEQMNPPGEGFGLLLKAGANLSLKLGELTDQLKKDASDRKRAAQMVLDPIPRDLFASPTTIVGQTVFADMGSPQRGRKWIVRQFSAANAAGVRATTTATAVTADLYVASGVQTVTPNGFKWALATPPATQNFTSDVIVVEAYDHLIVGVGSATAPIGLLIRVTVMDVDVAVKAMNINEL